MWSAFYVRPGSSSALPSSDSNEGRCRPFRYQTTLSSSRQTEILVAKIVMIGDRLKHLEYILIRLQAAVKCIVSAL